MQPICSLCISKQIPLRCRLFNYYKGMITWCLHDHQPCCQGHNCALHYRLKMAIQFALRYQVICQKQDTRGLARLIGSPLHIILVGSPHRSRVQMTFVSHQMLCGRCHSIYCHHDLLVQNDHRHREEHIKEARRRWRGAAEAGASNNFHPFPLRTLHFASGYCLAICCTSSLFDYIAKQTWSLCQMFSPSCCPSNSSLLGSFT